MPAEPGARFVTSAPIDVGRVSPPPAAPSSRSFTVAMRIAYATSGGWCARSRSSRKASTSGFPRPLRATTMWNVTS